jgi:hypothetical protein
MNAPLKWVWIAGQLSANPEQPVRCPFCEAAQLTVFDIPKEAGKPERRILCMACKEMITLRNPT